MTYKLIIPGSLPGLNEYINAERCHRIKAAKMKKSVENVICYLIRIQLKGVHIKKPVWISYKWVERNRMRDKDNIAFARKFAQDSLVKAGTLTGDGWKEISGFSDSFEVDAKNPRVEIEIMEDSENGIDL